MQDQGFEIFEQLKYVKESIKQKFEACYGKNHHNLTV